MDFLMICKRINKGIVEVYPKFRIIKSKDLMIRGSDFYAIWDENERIWSTDEQDAIRLIDNEIDNYIHDHHLDEARAMYLWDADTCMIDKWHKYCQKQCRDNYHMLDEKLIFANDKPRKTDYASKSLSYPLEEAETPAWDELVGTLYSDEERHKIEWSIGSIVSGDSKKIQKFLVFYGAAGTGKSTVLNVIQMLFEGYYSVFDAKALGSSNNTFALESFKSNPLVAIQHDGDLSKIEDNTRLNSLVSHELMTVNEKFKSTYSSKFKAFLFMGTNKPVKITDAKSGLIRRLIDVSPSGKKVPPGKYKKLVAQIPFELGGIASHSLKVYQDDPGYYDDYIPINMMGASNDFFNFVLDNYYIFKNDDQVTLKAAWEMYRTYCEESNMQYTMSKRVFKEELKNYFWDFEERVRGSDNQTIRNLYSGFRADKFKDENVIHVQEPETLIKFSKRKSIFDEAMAACPAQYASEQETPKAKWSNVSTVLSDIDTTQLHYVKVPENHIVIDFDIPDENGNKSFEKNLKEASKWPTTYAELSKSGQGIHLHYIYDGDASKLQRIYEEHIEIKVFTGNSSLRRKLTKSNGEEIAHINSGLPLKGEKEVNFDTFKNEKALRTIISRNLRKEIHPATKPSIDFIFKNLEDAYESGMSYDVSDMRGDIFDFASNSTNQAEYCLSLVPKMHFKSKDKELEELESAAQSEGEIAFFDVEVFPNLFIINWKTIGMDKVMRLIQPSAQDVENLMAYRLVGFNCRRYDNHILYGRLLGYNNEQLFKLSQSIVAGESNVMFREAYDISYTDIYDYAAKKQSLKKWEIELGIHHQELGLPWDQPVPEELWSKVAEYCDNDVIATEAVWNATQGDFKAREILAELSGLNVNSTTNSHTTRIIFGTEKNPHLVYTNLEDYFDGYHYISGLEAEDGKRHNMYRGVDLGFGGYVYANPGMYGRTVTFDVASMHPSSILAMNCFGEYTKNFKDIFDTRLAIKHKDFDKAKTMLGGKMAKYLDDPSLAKSLSQALKIAINSVYGLTSASFANPFKDPRNVNNIVALRGALFMKTLQDEVEAMGYTVAHIKTDSIKIVEPDDKIISFVMDFGQKYGYTFEIEHIFEKICLVNDAVYIAKLAEDDPDDPGQWTATGTQFAVPYVFKTLFSKEPIIFDDLCETKSVKTALYIARDGVEPEDYQFIGKVGLFCPMQLGAGGGKLYSKRDDKFVYATGAKGYEWEESEAVRLTNRQDYIDRSYYDNLVTTAIDTISQYGDFYQFVD